MFGDYVQPTIDFVRAHQGWAAPIVFMLAFAESLAFISLLVPAWAALVGIGAVIAAGLSMIIQYFWKQGGWQPGNNLCPWVLSGGSIPRATPFPTT